MITSDHIGDVLVITADNPPVNALAHGVRKGLLLAICNAETDEAAKVIVLRCVGRTFFAGADISEFGKAPLDPGLNEVVDAIEACDKPIIAMIHGTALGGGLEVALACHYRIAASSASLGLPEVKLGLLPGAGGTQRLPRLIAMPKAAEMILFGNPVSAAEALQIGLVDRVSQDDRLYDDARAFADEVKGVSGFRRAGRSQVVGTLAELDAFSNANAGKRTALDAHQAILAALCAAVELPFEAGRAVERESFGKLLGGVQSRALRHSFFAERRSAKLEGELAGQKAFPIRKVGILGAGTMGGGIAMNFLSAGIPVTLVEREREPLDRGVATIRRNYERTVSRGRLTGEELDRAMGLLTPTLSFEDLADCDLVIEAVFELMDIKKDVFAKLDAIMKPGAIMATNTSYLDVDEIAAATGRPEWVIGLHFFSPANVMKLLEIVRGTKTDFAVVATAMKLARTIGKIAVVSKVCFGFIGNRMLGARQQQASSLSEEGARPAAIDQVLLDFGFPMGPFQMVDLAGVDIGWDPRTSSGRTARERLCEAGLLGQKTRHGFYEYDVDRRRTPSAAAEQIIRDFAAEHAVVQRSVSDREILERLLYSLVNEGALILEEGVAQRASDIDVVWVNGYGWPAQTGGPMFWADTLGLDTIVAGLERYREQLGPDFRIAKLLTDKAARREPFNC